jgi:predicted Zn-dependent protease
MKNIIIIILFLFPSLVLTQTNFTHDNIVKITKSKRWESDVKIFIYGDCDSISKNTINKTISHFNNLMETIQISVVDKKEDANTIIYFLTDKEYQNLFSYCDHSDNVGATYVKRSLNLKNTIIEGDVHIDTQFSNSSIQHTIKHEMFHMLGFHHHKDESSTIIKHAGNFTQKDDEMIKYLYSKDFEF